jgi:hypothetical protein
MPIIAAIVVLALAAGAAGWYFFLRPMDAAEYKAKITEQLQIYKNGTAALTTAMSDFGTAVGTSPTIDEASLSTFKTSMQRAIDQMSQGAAGVRGLRPPAEYAEAHKQIIAFLDLTGTGFPIVQDAVAATTAGESVEAFQTRMSDLSSKLPDSQAASEGYAKACETLGISAY